MANERAVTENGPVGKRRLTWWQFVLLAVVYIAIIQIGGLVLGSDMSKEETFETAANIMKVAVVPIAVSCLFAIALVSWLGWWQQIIHEPKRVRRWVWVVPILLVGGTLVGSSWGNLLDQNVEIVLALILLVSLVGFTEELMFRGVGVVTFRQAGMTEVKVALYTSIIFGAVHLSNAISTGADALLQAAVVSVSGYFFYLTRRVAGTILLAMPVHSSQDFVYLSGQIGIDATSSVLTALMMPIMVGLAITVWVRRRKIEPA